MRKEFTNTEIMKKRLTGYSSWSYGDTIWIENSLMPSTWTYKEVVVVCKKIEMKTLMCKIINGINNTNSILRLVAKWLGPSSPFTYSIMFTIKYSLQPCNICQDLDFPFFEQLIKVSPPSCFIKMLNYIVFSVALNTLLPTGFRKVGTHSTRNNPLKLLRQLSLFPHGRLFPIPDTGVPTPVRPVCLQ